jgi:lipopolysaccharide export system protein LptA
MNREDTLQRSPCRTGPRSLGFWWSVGAVFPPSILGLVLSLGIQGQAQEGLIVKDFKAGPSGYYPPPHQKQLKSLLTCASARQLPRGLWQGETNTFETFMEDGRREMLIQAPECVYDEAGDHSLRSPGPLLVQTADGKFSITGEGFRWQETNSILFISNRVHTTVHPDLLQGQSATVSTNKTSPADRPIEIFSDHFDYTGATGIGNHRGHVRVTGSEIGLTAATLEFLLPMKEKQLQRLTANGDVLVDSADVHASGQQVIYQPDTGLIHVVGEPTWQAALRQGSGDELWIDRSNHIFRAIGHGVMKMPRESLGASGFVPLGANTTNAPGTNQTVEIRSDSYELRTNSAAFEEHVRVTERAGEQTVGTLSCARLRASFTGTNQLDRLIAEQDVVIEQEPKKFTADKAIYTGTNAMLELTGNPAWQDGTRQGTGEVLLMNTAQNELVARGNAVLRLPAHDLAQSGSGASFSGGESSALAASNQWAQILSREYTLRPDGGRFEGGVRVIHPQLQLSCETADLDLPQTPGGAKRLVAQRQVEFDLLDERGQKIHGTGQKAVYNYSTSAAGTNDTLELTGNPMLTMTNGTFENRVIILDRTSGKLIAPGRYLIRGVGEVAAAKTNALFAPKVKTRKKRVIVSPEPHD